MTDSWSGDSPCLSRTLLTPIEYRADGVPEPSSLEKTLARIPIVGWFFSGSPSLRQINQAVVLNICDQLEQRPPIPPSIWGDTNECQEVGALLAATIEQEVGFRDNSVIPDDALLLLFFGTDMEFLFVMTALAKKLDLPKFSLVGYSPDIIMMSVGQFLPLVMAKIEQAREDCRNRVTEPERRQPVRLPLFSVRIISAIVGIVRLLDRLT